MSALFQLPLFQSHSPTSLAAAVEIAPAVPTLLAKVRAAIEAAPNGLTDSEGMEVTGLEGNTYRPRRITLVEEGIVVDSGETRRTASGRKATVWRATQGERP